MKNTGEIIKPRDIILSADKPEIGIVSPERQLIKTTKLTPEEQLRVTEILAELRSMVQPHGLTAQITQTEREPDPIKIGGETQSEWDREFRKYMRRKQKNQVEKTFKETMGKGFKERHLILSDTQVPDTDYITMEAVYKFMQDFKPTHLWLNGDILNATTISRFGKPADYHVSFWDEIIETRALLERVTKEARKANPEVKMTYLEGNHEFRLQRYIDRNAEELAELEGDDGRYLTIPNLLQLRKFGIKWVSYYDDERINRDTTILHGTMARIKSGYTAQAYIDKLGESVIAGHTHRLALIFRTQGDKVRFGMETGSLCKKRMKVPYVKNPDWQQGVGILGIDDKGELHPAIISINNASFAFGGRVYRGK